jgi:hypothetical protein
MPFSPFPNQNIIPVNNIPAAGMSEIATVAALPLGLVSCIPNEGNAARKERYPASGGQERVRQMSAEETLRLLRNEVWNCGVQYVS